MRVSVCVCVCVGEGVRGGLLQFYNKICNIEILGTVDFTIYRRDY